MSTKVEMEKEIARLKRKVKKLEKKLVEYENECCSCTKLNAADYIVEYVDTQCRAYNLRSGVLYI